jgi:hypothetical protein
MKMKILALITALAVGVMSATAQGPGLTSDNITRYAGVPSNGTNQIDTLTIGGTPTGGTFTISASGFRTSPAITWSATNATLVANIDAALEGMNWVGTGGVTTAVGTMTAGIGTITLTFTGKNAKSASVPVLVANSSLTGTSPTAAITITTPGVEATFKNAKTGSLLVDSVTPDLYINDSTTAGSPTWTKVSP